MMRRFYALVPLLVVFLLSTETWAVNWNYEFTVNGIKYSQNGNEREIRMELGGGAYNNVVVPEVEVIGLEDEAYAGELVIPEYVEYWLKDDEMGEAYLKSPVVGIASEAFEGCSGITSVVMPNSIEYIGEVAFSTCESLKSITIGDAVKSIGGGAFQYCQNLASVSIGNSVTSIEDYTFYACSSLSTISIGSAVNVIGEKAFYHCLQLSSIEIPNSVTSIGQNAFELCDGLISLFLPNSITTISSGAFTQCKKLKSVTLGKSIKEIGKTAFGGCYELEEIRSLIDEPFTIEFVFPGIKENATLYVPAGTKAKYEATEGWKEFKNIVEIDPSSVTTVRTEQKANETVYNLSGQRVATPQKGLYIVNGRKVVMK